MPKVDGIATVGERVKLLRKSKGITLQEIQDMWKIGNKSHFSEIENNKGSRKYSVEQLFKLADLLGVTMEYLYTGIITRHDFKATAVRRHIMFPPLEGFPVIKHESIEVEVSCPKDLAAPINKGNTETFEDWTIINIEKANLEGRTSGG